MKKAKVIFKKHQEGNMPSREKKFTNKIQLYAIYEGLIESTEQLKKIIRKDILGK